MDHFELVEKLRERTGVSYEDAKAALEKADWDLLDAIVLLEAEEKIERGAKDYTTRREETREQNERKHAHFKGIMSRIGEQFVRWINYANGVNIDVSRNEKHLFSLTLTAMILLLLFMFWWVIPLMVVGLFFGFQYNVRGNDAVMNNVNRAMDKASEFAGSIKSEMQGQNKK